MFWAIEQWKNRKDELRAEGRAEGRAEAAQGLLEVVRPKLESDEFEALAEQVKREYGIRETK